MTHELDYPRNRRERERLTWTVSAHSLPSSPVNWTKDQFREER
jgi:hypothetical protein